MSRFLVRMRFDENGFTDLTGKQWEDYNVTYDEPGVFGGRCAYFDGKAKMLSEADENLNFGTKDFTFSCWVKKNQLQTCGLIAESTAGYTSGFLYAGRIGTNVEAASFIVNNGWQPSLTAKSLSPADNKWHHIAIVRKDGVFKFFIDGKLKIDDENKKFVTANYNLATKGTILGDSGYAGTNNYHGFKGYLDDVVIVDEALWIEEFEPPTDYVDGSEGGEEKPSEGKKILGYIPVYVCEDGCVCADDKCFKFIPSDKCNK